jgi:hypothetical protein
MARSSLVVANTDLVQDSGNVLWSFVKGEQLEFPIELNFVEDATAGYTYEALLVEALNVVEQSSAPIDIKAGGIQTSLVIRVPVNRGNWNSSQAYNKEEVVKYDGLYYKLQAGIARTSVVTPDLDTFWTFTNLSTVYLQFPKSLGADWEITPLVGYPVYGFFELRVTEPFDGIFQRTWKPIRGTVQILFSPTYSIGD